MKKEVCIVHTVEWAEKGYQIMRRAESGFIHVFPGVTFTLENAQDVCREYGFNVVATGDFWQCLED